MMLSPRIILPAGAAGALIMALAGFQLGSPKQARHGMAMPPPVAMAAVKEKPRAASVPVAAESRASRAVSEPADAHVTVHSAPLTAENQKIPVTQGRLVPGQPRSGMTSPRAALPAAAKTPQWPMIFKMTDAAAGGMQTLPAQYQAAVQKLQDQFVKEVGGTQQNAADPGYAERWLSATQRADDLLRAQIGWQAFNAYSMSLAKADGAPQ